MTTKPVAEHHARRIVPWLVLSVFVVYVGVALLRPVRHANGLDVAGFGHIPVMMNGRVQPMDSVARLGLLQVRGSVRVPIAGESRQAWQFWRRPRELDATEWLLELLMKPEAADGRKVFPIDDAALAQKLRLSAPPRSGVQHYSFKELQPRLESLGKEARRIAKVQPANRAPWERACLKLRNAVVIYERLKNSIQPNSYVQQEAGGAPLHYDFAALLTRYRADLRVGVQAAVSREHGKQSPLDKPTEARMRDFARPFMAVSRAGLLAVVPPSDPVGARDGWRNIGTVMVDSARTGALPAPVTHYAALSSAYAQGKALLFNAELENYQRWLAVRGLQPELSRAKYEVLHNRFQPFVRATAVYLIAFLLVGGSWWRRSANLYRSAAAVTALAWALHTTGLLFDMMLEGRPPVTNMYSLLVFAGWGAVALGLAIERYFRNGISLAATVLAALVTQVIAHNLAPGGAVELMIGALDVQFWIATLAAGLAIHFGGAARPPHVRSAIELRWSS